MVGWWRLCHLEWLRAIVEFGGIECYREGTLEPRGAHLYQLAHSFVVQPHCNLGVRGEGEYPRSRLGGQPMVHYIWIKHENLQALRWTIARELKHWQVKFGSRPMVKCTCVS